MGNCFEKESITEISHISFVRKKGVKYALKYLEAQTHKETQKFFKRAKASNFLYHESDKWGIL